MPLLQKACGAPWSRRREKQAPHPAKGAGIRDDTFIGRGSVVFFCFDTKRALEEKSFLKS
jgi:hypothetical protein